MVNYLSDVGVDFGEGDMTGSPRTRPGDRRSSTVTLLSLGERRRGSVVSVVSTSSENVVRLRVRTNRKRRLSCTSPLSVNLPIVIVTLHQDNLSQTLAQRADPAWEKGYKNFKFRSENLLNYFIVFSTLGWRKQSKRRKNIWRNKFSPSEDQAKVCQSKWDISVKILSRFHSLPLRGSTEKEIEGEKKTEE